jgi:hypothetical protein
LLQPDKILTITNSTKKHTRIVLSEMFVMEYFYFLEDSEIEPGSDYDLFMRQVFDYPKDETESDGKDDAPDALSGLAAFIQGWLGHLFKQAA